MIDLFENIIDYGMIKIMYVEFQGESDIPMRQVVCVGSCFRRDLELQKSPGNIVFEIATMDRAMALLIVYDAEAEELVYPPAG
jgi:hypothetical protein